MTGGQPVDGPISVHAIAHEVRANGVARIAFVSDEPEKFNARDFPDGVTFDSREKSRRGAARTARNSRRHRPDLRAGLRHRKAAAAETRQLADPPKLRLHQRSRLRGMRRLFGRVQLPQRRAEGNAVRPQAPDQPVHLQQGFFLPERLLPEFCHCRRRDAAQEDRRRTSTCWRALPRWPNPNLPS